MLAPPIPDNEDERLAVLRSCGVLDVAPEPVYDDIARLARQLCDVPIAIVSLIDRDTQWFKARVGLEGTSCPRERTFCAHVLVTPRSRMIVRDTLEDPRFVRHPAVTGEPYVRFYAGVPLVLDGAAVGTLCVVDRVPRELSAAQLDALELLARQVTNELQLRRRLDTRPRAGGGTEPGLGAEVDPVVLAGRWALGEILGMGGMGIVVAATDMRSGARVAIKFLLRETMRDDLIERFVREAQILARVDSRHVTRILDVGNLGNGAPYIVMERLVGEDLDAMLERRGPLPVNMAVGLMLQACAGVRDVHAAGVLHRDIKPSNLFLAREDGSGAAALKILDFGIGALLPASGQSVSPLTHPSALLGTPQYMSPEQMRLSEELDGRTDVWSLGVVLYELLTSRRPFDGSSTIEVCAAVLHDAPPPLGELRSDLPPGLAEVVERCLVKPRAGRYPSVAALAGYLAVYARRAAQTR